jgi:hypothetical protein
MAASVKRSPAKTRSNGSAYLNRPRGLPSYPVSVRTWKYGCHCGTGGLIPYSPLSLNPKRQ